MPSKDIKEAFQRDLKISLENKDNPFYAYPLKLSENAYALILGPNDKMEDGSSFEPNWIKFTISAYWIKGDIGVTVGGINIEKDEFAKILEEVNNQI
jgi:hypothetical protein